MLEQLLNTLLAFPALPSVLPIESLTRLSASLPLFAALLPLAVQRPELLDSGRLVTESGKTFFLGNLVTFGVTGGMLARYGLKGAQIWINVIGNTLTGVKEGWGRWADGFVEEDDEPMPLVTSTESDDDDEVVRPGPLQVSSATRQKPRRSPLAPNVQKKVTVLASPNHLSMLTTLLLVPSAPSTVLTDFANFALSLLNAFRGSPKWEGILEAFLTGAKGKALEKRIWREGVRGKWPNSGDRSGWDHFAESKSLLRSPLRRSQLMTRPLNTVSALPHSPV